MTEAIDPRVEQFARGWMAENAAAMTIDGFGPDDPPPPPLPASFQVRELGQKPLDPGEEEDEVSPLVKIAQPPPPPLPVPPEPNIVEPRILVADGQAAFLGRAVELSEQDQASIARIILEAEHRRLRSQLEEVRRMAPRRRVTAKPPPVVAEPKKKRGRPRKEG